MHYEELNCHIMLRIHSEKLEFKEIKKYKPDKTGSQVFFLDYLYDDKKKQLKGSGTSGGGKALLLIAFQFIVKTQFIISI